MLLSFRLNVMTMMQDRRHEERLVINEEVFDVESGRSLGFTLNVNTYGMLLVSKQPYDDGETLRIRINTPIEDVERVSMCVLADSTLHQNGFQFSHPNNANIEYTRTLFNAISAS